MNRRNFITLLSFLTLGWVGGKAQSAPHPRASDNRLDELGSTLHEAIEKLARTASVPYWHIQIHCSHEERWYVNGGMVSFKGHRRNFHLHGRLNNGGTLYIDDPTLSGLVKRAYENLADSGQEALTMSRAEANRLDEQGTTIFEAIEKIAKRASTPNRFFSIHCSHQESWDVSSGVSTFKGHHRKFHLSGMMANGGTLYIDAETLGECVQRANESLTRLGL